MTEQQLQEAAEKEYPILENEDQYRDYYNIAEHVYVAEDVEEYNSRQHRLRSAFLTGATYAQQGEKGRSAPDAAVPQEGWVSVEDAPLFNKTGADSCQISIRYLNRYFWTTEGWLILNVGRLFLNLQIMKGIDKDIHGMKVKIGLQKVWLKNLTKNKRNTEYAEAMKQHRNDLALILIGIIIMAFSSCSTTKQKSVTKSRTSTSVDSSSNTSTSSTVDSGRVVKDRSITTVTTDDSTVTVTVIEYNNDSLVLDAIFNRGSNGTATDYIQPIRTITTRTATRAKAVTVTAVDVVDSSGHRSTAASAVRIQVHKASEISTYSKNKEVSRWNLMWLLLLIPAWIFRKDIAALFKTKTTI